MPRGNVIRPSIEFADYSTSVVSGRTERDSPAVTRGVRHAAKRGVVSACVTKLRSIAVMVVCAIYVGIVLYQPTTSMSTRRNRLRRRSTMLFTRLIGEVDANKSRPLPEFVKSTKSYFAGRRAYDVSAEITRVNRKTSEIDREIIEQFTSNRNNFELISKRRRERRVAGGRPPWAEIREFLEHVHRDFTKLRYQRAELIRAALESSILL